MKKVVLIIGLLNCVIWTQAQDLEAISWKKGITTSGGLSFNNTFYSGNDPYINRDPYAFYLNGTLNVNVIGIDLPFSFSYSNTNKSYTQPFNRFQFAPKYKWIKLYFGNTSMNFSQYTLAGHQFNGAGMELTPGNWSISAMYGRLLKPVDYNSIVNNIESVAYKRMGYGAKVGYNNGSTDANIIFFHAEDDRNSLKYQVPVEANLHAQKNTTISANLRQNFLKYFFAQAEYAFSVYNSEICNLEGVPSQQSDFIDKIFDRKGNDRYLDAMNASIGFQNPVWGISLCYERVSPDYQTLGGYFFTNDMENFTIAPNVRFFQGKLNLSGNVGFQYNNLNNQKADNTSRIVGSGNIAYSDGKAWNASFSYSNFSTYTKYRPVAYPYYVDQLDTLNFYQVTQSFNASLAYTFGAEVLRNTVSVMGNYQNGNTEAGNVRTSDSDIICGTLSFAEMITPQNMSWSVFATANYCNATTMQTLFWGPGASIGKTFFDKTLDSSLSCGYNRSEINGKDAPALLNVSLSLKYNLKALGEKYGQHALSFTSNYSNRFKTAETVSSSEFLANLTYSVNF